MQILQNFSSRTFVSIGVTLFGLTAYDLAHAQTTCPQTSVPETHSAALLQSFAANTGQGVEYDTGLVSLVLGAEGANFVHTNWPIAESFYALATGDFDGDGWEDFVAGYGDTTKILFFKNRTGENPAPDWTNPITEYRIPKFSACPGDPVTSNCPGSHYWEYPGTAINGFPSMSSGDYNGDGKMDFFHYKRQGSSTFSAQIFLGNGDGTFQTPYQMIANLNDLGTLVNLIQTNVFSTDWNNDGRMDILWGNGQNQVIALLNTCTSPCSGNPMFQPMVVIADAGFGGDSPLYPSRHNGVNTISYADFTGDGYKDLLLGSSTSASMKLYPGSPAGIEEGNFQLITDSLGQAVSATGALGADFSLDGKADIVMGDGRVSMAVRSGGQDFLFCFARGEQPIFVGNLSATAYIWNRTWI